MSRLYFENFVMFYFHVLLANGLITEAVSCPSPLNAAVSPISMKGLKYDTYTERDNALAG